MQANMSFAPQDAFVVVLLCSALQARFFLGSHPFLYQLYFYSLASHIVLAVLILHLGFSSIIFYLF